MPGILVKVNGITRAALDAAIEKALENMRRPDYWIEIEEQTMLKAELEQTIEAAHALLDRLVVARGDAYGAWTLERRIRELAETVTPERADMARAAHRRLHGEE